MWAIDCRGRLDLGGYTLFDDHRSTLGHRSVGTPGTVAGLAALHRPCASAVARAARAGGRSRAQRILGSRLHVRDAVARLGARVARSPRADGVHTGLGSPLVPRCRRAEAGRRSLVEPRPGGDARSAGHRWPRRLLSRRARRGDRRGARAGWRLCHARRPRRLSREALPTGRGMVPRVARVQQHAARRRRDAGADAAHPGSLPAGGCRRARDVCDACGSDAPRLRRAHALRGRSGIRPGAARIALNSAMDNVDPLPGRPNSIAPGKARLSAMAPTIVFDGRLPGSSTAPPGPMPSRRPCSR